MKLLKDEILALKAKEHKPKPGPEARCCSEGLKRFGAPVWMSSIEIEMGEGLWCSVMAGG